MVVHQSHLMREQLGVTVVWMSFGPDCGSLCMHPADAQCGGSDGTQSGPDTANPDDQGPIRQWRNTVQHAGKRQWVQSIISRALRDSEHQPLRHIYGGESLQQLVP